MWTIIKKAGINIYIKVLQKVEKINRDTVKAIRDLFTDIDMDNYISIIKGIKGYPIELYFKKNLPKDFKNVYDFYDDPQINELIKKDLLKKIHKDPWVLPTVTHTDAKLLKNFKSNEKKMNLLQKVIIKVYEGIGFEYDFEKGMTKILPTMYLNIFFYRQKNFLNNTNNSVTFLKTGMCLKDMFGLTIYRKMCQTCSGLLRQERTITIPSDILFIFSELNIKVSSK